MKNRFGQSLIEILIAFGVAAIILPALVTGFIASTQGKAQQRQRLNGITLLVEGQEAVRNVRERDWASFSQSGTYYAITSGALWTLTATVQPLIDGSFSRTIIITDVYRDKTTLDIVASGSPNSALDPSTKKVVVTVAWTEPNSSTVSSTAYLTRQQNLTWTQTFYDEFNEGSPVSVAVNNTTTNPPFPAPTTFLGDGEVDLGAGSGGSDWCQPQESVVKTFNLLHSGVPIAITAASLATQDLAYTTTGDNSSGNSVDKLTISQDGSYTIANPNFNNEAKAYGIYTDGTYVYFNEKKPPDHTVRIANASDLAPIGYFDAENGTGNSVFVSGTIGYTTVGSFLYAFDLSSKTGSRPQVGNATSLAGTGYRVVVVGTNAYVATGNSTNQLQIVSTATMAVTKSINLGNGVGAVDVFVDSSERYAYIVTNSNSGNNFFIIDLNDTSKIYGYQTTGGMKPNGIIVPTPNRAVIVGSGGELYQVFDITVPSNASHCGGMSPGGVTKINAVSGVVQTSTGKVFSYIITDNASAEFQIIQGGPGSTVSTSGTFTSSTFDPCAPPLGYCNGSTFNWLSADVTQPLSGGNQVQLQVAVATPIPATNSCTGVTFTYIGPLGTTGDYYQSTTQGTSQITGAIPFSGPGTYLNPGRCFSYKAFLSTTDLAQQPTLYDVNINYSP